MMQTLLAERFKLAVHRETQQGQVYTLVIGKNGSKLQDAKEGHKSFINWAGPGHVTFTEANLLALVNILSGLLGNPVRDETGLKGLYNFSLNFEDPRLLRARDGGHPPPSGSNPPPLDPLPDIFTAVQEQLGLKLEAKKGPVEILVIDHMERPSEN